MPVLFERFTEESGLRAVWPLMEEAFPPEERRSFAAHADILADFRYMADVLRLEGEFVGFMGHWNFQYFHYIEHLAVKKEFRGRGIGKAAVSILIAEGRPLVLEAEIPPGPKTVEARRIGFYERLGFTVQPYDYLQPPYDGTGPQVPLLVLTHGMEGLSAEAFSRLRDTLHREVYGASVSSEE